MCEASITEKYNAANGDKMSLLLPCHVSMVTRRCTLRAQHRLSYVSLYKADYFFETSYFAHAAEYLIPAGKPPKLMKQRLSSPYFFSGVRYAPFLLRACNAKMQTCFELTLSSWHVGELGSVSNDVKLICSVMVHGHSVFIWICAIMWSSLA